MLSLAPETLSGATGVTWQLTWTHCPPARVGADTDEQGALALSQH